LNLWPWVAELRLRKGDNRLPQIKRGWRERVGDSLRLWYAQQYPESKTPNVKTIKRLLKSELDRIEEKDR
jgi:hypothetical protein